MDVVRDNVLVVEGDPDCGTTILDIPGWLRRPAGQKRDTAVIAMWRYSYDF
jgi:hypothetical protein